MFNPEQLLGQMLGQALGGQLGGKKRKHTSSWGGSGLSTGAKVKIGMGLLGVAMAAYEHYQSKPAAPAPAPGMPPPPPAGTAVPPPPPAAPAVTHEHAMHLLRAMITAAEADGLIDAEEQQTILARAREAGLSEEAVRSLEAEIRAPLTLPQLVARTPDTLRDEVYAAALIAITADTEAERQFLDRLAGQLGLDAAARQAIHQQLGVA